MPVSKAVRAFIGIGANLADPEASVRRGIGALAIAPDTRVVATSSLYRTAPVGRLDQPDFVNAVVELETGLDPGALLDKLLSIEKELGRERSTPNAPRILDLDLLIHGDQYCQTEHLTLPHPRMSERAFVLVPLVEIAADIPVGALGTAEQLLAAISTDGVERIGVV
jgi:2-amino-4-hydroxy-6-hydroxymethyldihydropteridine diphosphokinase